jgi:tetratricopeptide (TPR) repeat protein
MFRGHHSNHSLARLLVFFAVLLSCQLAVAQSDDQTNGEIDPVKLFERGQDAHARNDLKKAIEFYDAAIKLKPEFAEAEFQRAMALLATNQNTEAIEGFSRAVKLRPDWAMAYSKFGAFLGSYANEPAKAEPILRRAIELDQHDEFALTVLAEIRVHAGDVAEGLKLVRTATEKPTATSSTWRKRAYIENMAGDKMAAIASLDHALTVDAKDLGARYERIKLRLDVNDREGAVADLRALEQSGLGHDRSTALEYAQLYERAGKPGDAVRVLDALPETDRQTPEVIAVRAEITSGGGETTAEERAALEDLLQRDPRNASLLARLGSAYRRVDPTKSVLYYRRAMVLEPQNLKHQTGQAAALVQLRRFDQAEAILRKVIAAEPNDYTAHANLALALYEMKRFGEAVVEYEWLAKTRPEIAATYFFIATAHDNLGEYPQALDAYQQFLSHADPANNKLEIDKVNLRLPTLRAQIQRGQGAKRKNP